MTHEELAERNIKDTSPFGICKTCGKQTGGADYCCIDCIPMPSISNTVNTELATLRRKAEMFDEMREVLEDAGKGLESILRNETMMRECLSKCGYPSGQLNGIEPKLRRIRAVLAKARKVEEGTNNG